MKSSIPTPAEVRASLEALGHSQILRLSGLSSVSVTTLWSIRSGKRPNPGIDTVRKFLPHVAEAAKA